MNIANDPGKIKLIWIFTENNFTAKTKHKQICTVFPYSFSLCLYMFLSFFYSTVYDIQYSILLICLDSDRNVCNYVALSMITLLTNYFDHSPPPPSHKLLYSFDLPCTDQQFVDHRSFSFLLFSLYTRPTFNTWMISGLTMINHSISINTVLMRFLFSGSPH